MFNWAGPQGTTFWRYAGRDYPGITITETEGDFWVVEDGAHPLGRHESLKSALREARQENQSRYAGMAVIWIAKRGILGGYEISRTR